MIDLLPELSFGDNLQPSQVTPHLREELAEWERSFNLVKRGVLS